jgi:hypothetical protein
VIVVRDVDAFLRGGSREQWAAHHPLEPGQQQAGRRGSRGKQETTPRQTTLGHHVLVCVRVGVIVIVRVWRQMIVDVVMGVRMLR